MIENDMLDSVKYLFISFLFIFILSSCTSNPKTLFEEVPSGRTGITFRNDLDETPEFHVLNYGYFYNGGGVAIGDVNNDQLPDIYVTGNMRPARLYINQGDWRFKDVSEDAGVLAAGLWNTGTAMADVNGDGWMDIYVCRSAANLPMRRENLLFVNDGAGEDGKTWSGTFSEAGLVTGVSDQGYSSQAAFFDYDRDGDLDLYVLNHSVQEYAGFSRLIRQQKQQSNPFYGDRLYRNDLIPPPNTPPGSGFTDVTKEAGILTNVLGFGLGIAVDDINRDGWPDIYISNDYNEEDYLYINQQDGTFREELRKYIDHSSLFSMGSDMADINNDGLPDLVTLDMLPEGDIRQKMTSGADNFDKYQLLIQSGFYHQTMRNMLQINQGGGFAEVGQMAGISNTDWSWAALLADYDLDGWKDLFVTNGYESDYTNMDFLAFAADEKIKSEQSQKEVAVVDLLAQIPAIKTPNYIYQNNGKAGFINRTEDWGFAKPSLSNGAAYGDLDNDGDLDLVVNNINDQLSVYRNNADKLTTHHYLKIRLAGTERNLQGIGAEVCLIQDNRQNCQTLMPTRGFQSSVEPVLVFGLGEDSLVKQIRVRWPDGSTQYVSEVEADQTLEIRYESPVTSPPAKEKREKLFSPMLADASSPFTHTENAFVDFNREPLLPHFLSTEGPKMAVADVNGDQLSDLYIGGAKGQAGALLLQEANGTFRPAAVPDFELDAGSEDLEALFVDVDNDQDRDLYVVSGGNDCEADDPSLQDRLYLNNGKGRFSKANGFLPEMITAGSCVKAADYDRDGDQDLFVGGRLIPGKYPSDPRSYLLQNDGTGRFTDITESQAPDLLRPGLVTDAAWEDLNGDQQPDLIIVGEWMPISFFINTSGRLAQDTTLTIQHPASSIQHSASSHHSGWWNTLKTADLDQDGDADFIIGNLGLNSQIKATPQEPVQIYTKDFDNNGALDPILTYYIHGKSYPMASRDDLIGQLAFLKSKYLKYQDYAGQQIQDMFTADQLAGAEIKSAGMLSSIVLMNEGEGNFAIRPLPVEAQVAPVYAIAVDDLNGDTYPDLLLGGNLYGTRVKFGRYDANHGVVLLGDGKGGFNPVPQSETGWFVRGEVRDMAIVQTRSREKQVVVAKSNAPVEIYTVNPKSHAPNIK